MMTELSTGVALELQTVHLDAAQLAHRFNISTKTVYNKRSSGGQLPPCINFMGRPRWRLSDVIAWENANLDHAQDTREGVGQ